MVDEAKLASSKNYTCIMVGAYTKALLQEHVEVIRKVLTRYPLFLAKRVYREHRRLNQQHRAPPLSHTALLCVDVAWKQPANEEFVQRMVTPTHPLLSSPPLLPLVLTRHDLH
jgi:hypothetical protein